jgi:hypothetical protein
VASTFHILPWGRILNIATCIVALACILVWLFNLRSIFPVCMQAALYQTDFRPVPFEEYIKVGNTIFNKKMDIVRTISKQYDRIKVGNTIFNKKMDIVRTISKQYDLDGKDPDHIIRLG